jgi:hypothetical protein
VFRATTMFLLLAATACEGPEDRIAGRYVRTWREGVTPERGFDGVEPDRHVLILNADRTWTSEHPPKSIQQFDVPFDSGTWHLDGVTLTIRPTDLGPMQYTVNGDTLHPRTPANARLSEMATGFSMKIGANTYLVRER